MASDGERIFGEIAEEICVAMRRSGLDRMRTIGSLVLGRFFGGSVTAWRERRNHKNNSVRRLADHPACPLSRSGLNQAIGVHALLLEMPWVERLDRVDASHLVTVLPLSQCDRAIWLRRTQAERWSVRALRDAIRSDRNPHGSSGQRPRSFDGRRFVARSALALVCLEESIAHLACLEVDAFGLEQVASLDRRLAAIQTRIGHLSTRSSPVRALAI
jgi:hypothetical protein